MPRKQWLKLRSDDPVLCRDSRYLSPATAERMLKEGETLLALCTDERHYLVKLKQHNSTLTFESWNNKYDVPNVQINQLFMAAVGHFPATPKPTQELRWSPCAPPLKMPQSSTGSSNRSSSSSSDKKKQRKACKRMSYQESQIYSEADIGKPRRNDRTPRLLNTTTDNPDLGGRRTRQRTQELEQKEEAQPANQQIKKEESREGERCNEGCISGRTRGYTRDRIRQKWREEGAERGDNAEGGGKIRSSVLSSPTPFSVTATAAIDITASATAHASPELTQHRLLTLSSPAPPSHQPYFSPLSKSFSSPFGRDDKTSEGEEDRDHMDGSSQSSINGTNNMSRSSGLKIKKNNNHSTSNHSLAAPLDIKTIEERIQQKEQELQEKLQKIRDLNLQKEQRESELKRLDKKLAACDQYASDLAARMAAADLDHQLFLEAINESFPECIHSMSEVTIKCMLDIENKKATFEMAKLKLVDELAKLLEQLADLIG